MFAITKREPECEFLHKFPVQVPRWFVPSVSDLEVVPGSVNTAYFPRVYGINYQEGCQQPGPRGTKEKNKSPTSKNKLGGAEDLETPERSNH